MSKGTAGHSMRILEIETFGRGGLIHYAYNLSCALAERGHEVTLVTTAGYELEGRSLPVGCKLVKAIARVTQRIEGSWPGFVIRLLRKLEAIYDACAVALLTRRLRPDVVHLHCTNPIALLYVVLLRLVGFPAVATAHVVTPHERIPFQDGVYGCIHRMSRLIIAHSDFDRKRLREEFAVDAERVVVIPHGEYGFFERLGEAVDRLTARRHLGLGAQDEVALFFGYIREYKGLDVLLEAWPEVLAARPRARLVIAGDPVQLSADRREELAAWATRLSAIHRFAYIPFADVPGYFGAADVLVMPYRHISQSGVLYLALAMGVPVVATRVGALPEMLRDGDSALLVPSESPADLSAALCRALGDPALRERLAHGGRQIAAQHTWPAIAARTETAFARLTASNSTLSSLD